MYKRLKVCVFFLLDVLGSILYSVSVHFIEFPNLHLQKSFVHFLQVFQKMTDIYCMDVCLFPHGVFMYVFLCVSFVFCIVPVHKCFLCDTCYAYADLLLRIKNNK